MKAFFYLFFIVNIASASTISNGFAEKIDKSKEVESETFVSHEKINKELIRNIAIKANNLKKTDENYMRAGIEKSLTGIYVSSPFKLKGEIK